MTITRRQFAPAAALATLAASPAFAQQTSEIVKWRFTSSFPKSLDTLWGAAADRGTRRGRADRRQVPAPDLRRRRDRARPAGARCGGQRHGRDAATPTAATTSARIRPSIFDGSLPFGFTPRQHDAWMMFGDGRKLMDEVYDSFNIVCIPAGNTGGQMFGWFRKEIKTPEDFEGLKMRTAASAARSARSSARCRSRSPAARSILRWRRGTIDACEWVGPYDDEKLGFNKVAKYYYTPGVMELEATNVLMSARRRGLNCRRATRRRCATPATMRRPRCWPPTMPRTPKAIARLVAAGTQLSVLPRGGHQGAARRARNGARRGGREERAVQEGA